MNFAELNARRHTLRKQPGHCSICARPWQSDEYKTCDKCRARQAKIYSNAKSIGVIERRVVKLEMRLERQDKEIKRLRRLHELARRRAYINGARAAIKKIQSPTPEDAREITVQEAAQISHAYGNF